MKSNNNIEKEIQFILLDEEKFRLKINELGFTLSKTRKLRDTYYSSDGTFDQDSFVRIRDYGTGVIELTYKKSNSVTNDVINRTEINLKIDSFENAESLINELGLKIVLKRSSIEEQFKKDDLLIEIIDMIEPKKFKFAEIEGPSEDKIGKIEKELDNLIKIIGKDDFPEI